MATAVTWNGISYSVPGSGELDWGGSTKVDGLLISLAQNGLQKSGGTFALSADIDFSSSAGLKAIYLKSRAAAIASAGVIRIGNAEVIAWRNAADNGNNTLVVNASDQLVYNGTILASSAGVVPVAAGGTGLASYTTGDMLYASGATTLAKLAIGTASYVAVSTGSAPSWALLVNANIDAAAAIAYSKLTLTGSIVNADVNASAAIVYSKLSLTGGIVNADINASAAIVYSKLSLTGGVVNADIGAAAAIARTKIASGTNYRILANSSSGVMSENAALTSAHVIIADANGQLAGEATLAKSRGGCAADMSSVTFPSTGTIPTNAGAATFTNKTIGDALLMTQVATPSSPSAGLDYLYFKSDDNLYFKTSAGTENQLLTSTNAEPRSNFLYNSNFLIWQRGTTVTIANAASTYLADRWYVKNSLGTNGVITFSRVASTDTGAVYDASVKITTAPTAAQTNGCELYQVLENADSLQLFGQTASFTIRIKALGNVNQIGVQFYYKTTEAKVDTAIGSEATATVSTGAYASATISGQALGTSMTTAGVVGVRIRITGVSSGNLYDLNNGFLATFGMLNIGAVVATYQPKHKSFQAAVADCERFYQKSYELDVAPATVTAVGQMRTRNFSAGADMGWTVIYGTRMRSAATLLIYNPQDGSSGSIRDSSNNSNPVTTTIDQGSKHGTFTSTSVANAAVVQWHWTAIAEI